MSREENNCLLIVQLCVGEADLNEGNESLVEQSLLNDDPETMTIEMPPQCSEVDSSTNDHVRGIFPPKVIVY